MKKIATAAKPGMSAAERKAMDVRASLNKFPEQEKPAPVLKVVEKTDPVTKEEVDAWRLTDEAIENMDRHALRHDIKIKANQLARECRMAGIPMFLAWFNDERQPGKRYQYAAMFPEEMPEEEGVRSEYDKFKRFLQVVIDFDKRDYEPIISERVPWDESIVENPYNTLEGNIGEAEEDEE